VLALAIVAAAATAGVAAAAQTIVTGAGDRPGREGPLQNHAGSCTPTTVTAGETYIEVPNVPVLAVAKREIEWTTTLIYETGQPAATPVTSPCAATEEEDDD
jgi:hypothetical protein